jgi:hypothetical protein
MSQRRPSTSTIVVAVIAIVVVVAAVVVLWTTDVTGPGLKVNGTETSRQTIDDELHDFAGSTLFANSYSQSGARFKTTQGAVNSFAGAQWIAFRVQRALAERLLEQRGKQVTERDLSSARTALRRQGVFEGMSGDAVDQLVAYQATLTKLQNELGSRAAVAQALRRAVRRADVDLDPRYGTWNRARLGICPPAGCRQIASLIPPTQ